MIELPKLKRVLNKTEAKIDSKVLQYLLDTRKKSFALEVKMRGGKFPDHQIRSLDRVAKGKFGYKIPDSSLGKLPFDCVGLIEAESIKAVCQKFGMKYVCNILVEPTGEDYDITI